jgi:hypothetical protein
MHRLLAGAIIISVVACEDSTGPGVRGRLLGPASLAVEWSVDGTEIYHYSSGFSSTVPVFIPDQILATNAATGASRVVVGSCVWSIGATIRPTIMPPRATVAGLVYLEGCTPTALAVRLRSGASDSILAGTKGWFTSCPNRDCVIYAVADTSTSDDSIGVIDLPQGDRRVFGIGGYRPSDAAAVSPDGTALLLEQTGVTNRFAILNLASGALDTLPDSILPFPYEGGTPLGWNHDGLWFLAEPRITIVRYDPATGGIERFSTGDMTGGTRVITGGSITATTSVISYQNCISYDPQTADCTQVAYGLWLWNPLLALDRQLELFYTPAHDFPRMFHAATSPNGQQVAYVLGNELRVVAAP